MDLSQLHRDILAAVFNELDRAGIDYSSNEVVDIRSRVVNKVRSAFLAALERAEALSEEDGFMDEVEDCWNESEPDDQEVDQPTQKRKRGE